MLIPEIIAPPSPLRLRVPGKASLAKVEPKPKEVWYCDFMSFMKFSSDFNSLPWKVAPSNSLCMAAANPTTPAGFECSLTSV